MKNFLRAAGFAFMMAASAITQASNYDFSYVFTTGDVITGSFDGTANGNLITIQSNLAISLDGVAFDGSGALISRGVAGIFASGPGIVSLNGLENNFIAFDSNFTNFLVMAPFNGGATDVANYSTLNAANADGPGAEGPYDASRWTIAAVSTVPEPPTYALLLGGLGIVGAMVRRRRMSAAALAC
ncbi:MAG TPA: PEP-CTERM sorting domain-containing protein [Telluria sp.]|nr:PEP-CTERM sorting domain-containing protein [Telluria sp.]